MTMQAIELTPRAKGNYGYYRQPDGFITASPMTDSDELQYRRSGWEPLRQYGQFEMTTPYSAAHPLENLFMLGGARELSERQVREQGWHLQPVYVPSCRTPLSQEHKRHTGACLANQIRVVFPQLERMTDLGPFPCQMPGCARPPFPTREARDQHEGVMHKPEKSDERTGQSLAAALVQGLGGHAPVSAVAIVDPVNTLPSAPAPAPLTSIMTDPTVAALLEQVEQLRAELAAAKLSSVNTPPQTKAKAKREPYDRNQSKHNHERPYGLAHLQAGCPRCEELLAGV